MSPSGCHLSMCKEPSFSSKIYLIYFPKITIIIIIFNIINMFPC